ncbi:hypothetical protein Mame_01096 [Martelella mediterranea DSM 17316]|uniref:Uncharacterized protein n=1 Tax=Martelella mediterranea DSM 17316 TaxID=1122214 RepID=A0A1U9YYF1_9HYPH|nr:hypothetical protein Mame_01096 [Martelella mediterranea DSM 17316]
MTAERMSGHGAVKSGFLSASAVGSRNQIAPSVLLTAFFQPL